MSIELTGAAYSYKLADGERAAALEPTDLTIAPGEFVAVVGANGSGKTTLAKLMNGLIFTTAGTVTIDGRNIASRENDIFARRSVGMVFQNPDNQLVATIVEDDVAFGPENLGVPTREIRERVDAALAEVGLPDLARSDPHNLSAGQRQKVAIAGVLAMRPRYIVFDEPTSLLDPTGRAGVLEIVRRLRRETSMGLVYITHIMEEVAAADRVIVMSEGAIIADGAPRRILADTDLLERASLGAPKPAQLARRLSSRGLSLPRDLITEEEVAHALCSLN